MALSNLNVHLKTDNITAMYYVNKMGGTKSKNMCRLSLDIWNDCLKNKTNLFASYIPGIDNKEADYFSRSHYDNHDYSISQETYESLTDFTGIYPEIDLFASRITKKVEIYVSRVIDPFAWEVDAFSIDWPDNVYMFPPIPLIHRTVEKFMCEKLDQGILITPFWAGLPDLPLICGLLSNDPILLPASSIEGRRSTRHPYQPMAWIISTTLAKQKAYQKIREMRCCKASQKELFKLTNFSGKSFISGLYNRGIIIKCPFQ